MFIKKLFIALIMFLPYTARAQSARIKIPNPLQAENIPELAGQMIKGLMGVTGAIALFMLVWGGIVWMTSQGSADRLKQGKDTVLWAILGLIIIFMSYVILNFVFTLIGSEA
ncbi:MAG: TrbC/VirB2 family protein [Patescibacteria group bacterium]|jgi:hypothetical protein